MTPFKQMLIKYPFLTEEELTDIKLFCLGYFYEIHIRGDVYNKHDLDLMKRNED